MNHGTTFAIVFALLALMPLSAQSGATVEWKNLGVWRVAIDKTDGSCFFTAPADNGTAFRMGLNPAIDGGYFLVGNKGWYSLEEGRKYDLKMQFDDLPPWGTTASVMKRSGISILRGKFNSDEFLKEFIRSRTFSVWYRGKKIATLSLKGSAAAVKEMATCQVIVNKEKSKMEGKSDDPFKR